ncbi:MULTISPECIES: hypothetical protein [unclassified Aureimonas]|uniref:hypothetical protein n=1 Tax=unclassified Aureimonas TaxID=2615206 RepID=UPI0006F4DE4F|nr:MULTISPECIES: hypothetical protein [unclassified Aureimonas]KQT52266.1 hypothetical protein ASG62_16555 [Aureimonas sp. Leaf427]KQT73240.1 hypothetical protein ASG54_17830 [Aureimonas sp. Leaf460]
MSNPKFYDRATDTGQTGEDGKAVYRLATYFLYQVDANNTVDREARQEDFDRFPVEYGVYDRTRQPDADGFPLAAWPGINAADRQGLADRGIFTVEKLAATDMARAPSDLREAQEKAKAFLAKTSSDGPKLAARIAELEDENAGLLDQIADMKSAIDDLKSDAQAPKLAAQVEKLKGEAEALQGEKSKLADEIAGLRTANETLTKDLAAAKKPAR